MSNKYNLLQKELASCASQACCNKNNLIPQTCVSYISPCVVNKGVVNPNYSGVLVMIAIPFIISSNSARVTIMWLYVASALCLNAIIQP